MRYEFNVTDVAQLTSLQLDVRFDDGMMAFLNDREVEHVNFGEFWQKPQPAWNSSAGYMLRESSALVATNRGVEALTPVTFDLTPYLPQLVNGTNVLAFHLVNSGSTTVGEGKDDLLLEPVLTATRATAPARGTTRSIRLPAPTTAWARWAWSPTRNFRSTAGSTMLRFKSESRPPRLERRFATRRMEACQR